MRRGRLSVHCQGRIPLHTASISTQMRDLVDHAMDDMQTLAPQAQPDLEQLRMAYPPIGCWAPTCVIQAGTRHSMVIA